jgi:hypothetical protein
MTIHAPYFFFIFFPATGKPPKDIRKLKTQEKVKKVDFL